MINDQPLIPGDYQYNALNNGPISQRLWHKSKLDVIKLFLTEDKEYNIADIGCGSGIITERIASISNNYRLCGFDNNSDSIKFCQNTYSNYKNVCFNELNILSEDFSTDIKYDYVFSFEVIEHFKPEDVPIFLKNLYALGDNETKYIISTPDYESFWPIIELLLDTMKLVPQLKNNQHFTKFSKSNLKQTLEKHHFKVTRIFNFCGLSPFIAHASLNLAKVINEIEIKHNLGNLICCEFMRTDYDK